MSLFNEFDISANEERFRPVLKKINRSYDECMLTNTTYWVEGDRDSRVYAGDSSVYGEIYPSAPYGKNYTPSFNRVKRVVNMISGRQRQTRKRIVATPVENADAQTADQYSKVLMWVNNNDNIDTTFSDACEGSLITGLNLLHVYMDYRTDPISGNIKCDNLSYNSFMIDPYFRKRSLEDCNYIWTRKYLTLDEVISLLPGHAEALRELRGKDSRDGKFMFLPENFNFNVNSLLTYDEYYYKTFRTQRLLIDSQTGESTEWKHSNKDEQLQSFLRAYPTITVFEQEVPTVKLAIVVQNRVFYNDGQPSGIDEYPFCPVFAYYMPQLSYFSLRIQGVVRGLRDAQYLYNQRRAIEDAILRSTVNSGFIYKENALVNPKDIFMTGQGKGIALKDDAQMTDVVQIQSPAIHPSVFQVSENYAKEMNEITGLSEENLAASSEDIAGVLAMLRQGAGLIGLQGLFDGWDFALKLLGKIELKYIQANFMPGKIQNILEGDQPSDQFYSKKFGTYDVVVEEGANTTTQKQQALAIMLQLKEAGVQFSNKRMLELVTIPNKKEIMDEVAQQEEMAAKQAEHQMQIEMAKLQADTELSHARAGADRGLEVERTSRVSENQALAVERRAQAVRDENAAVLDLVKAFKELDTLDITHLKEMIMMQRLIKGQEQVVKAEASPREASPTANTATPKTNTQV